MICTQVGGLARLEPLRRGPGRALALPVDALDADRLAAALRSGAPRVSVAAATGADGRHRYALSLFLPALGASLATAPRRFKAFAAVEEALRRLDPQASLRAPPPPARRLSSRVRGLAAAEIEERRADLAAYVERLLDAYDGLGARARRAVASWLAGLAAPDAPDPRPGSRVLAARAREPPGRDALLSLCGPDDVARPARRAPSDDDLYRLASECRAVAPPAPRGAEALATLSEATAGALAALGERVDGALGTERPGRRAPGSLQAPALGGALATAAVGGGPEAAALGCALETTTAAVGATTEFLADGLFAIGDGLMGLGLGVPATGRRHRCGSLEAQVDEAKRAAALARGRCSTLEYHVDEAHHMAPLARVPAGAA